MMTDDGRNLHPKKSDDPSHAVHHYSPGLRNSRANLRVWAPLIVYIWCLVSLYPVYRFVFDPHVPHSGNHRSKTEVDVFTKTVPVIQLQRTPVPRALSTVEFDHGRISDASDTFASYNKARNCSISSLDLHGPFEPLCDNRESLMEAMTSGGRLGFDMPYSPRGCDMRWFSDEEICEILTRFEKVLLLGDSTMRNLAVAFSILLRRDLVNGGRTTWVEPQDGIDCRCARPFETSKCAFYSPVSTRVLWKQDPDSVMCSPEGRGGFEYNAFLEYPIKDEDLNEFTRHLSKKKPQKPYAFIMSHGLWNDLQPAKTFAWVDQAIDGITAKAPYLDGSKAFFPRLFLGPNAAGVRKPEIFIARQGNIAITKFEHTVGPFVKRRGFDFLGTYNATIQSENADGTHGGMRNNLLKAMMCLNWLNSLDVSLHIR